MKKNVFPIIKAVSAAVAAVAVNTAFHPCRSEMPMHCVSTTKYGTVVLAVLLVASLVEFFAKPKALRRTAGILSAVLSAALVFVPLLGHCGGAMMHCNTHTMPAFRVSGLILLAVSVAAAAAEFVAASKGKLRESV